jgi:hypothetical protein
MPSNQLTGLFVRPIYMYTSIKVPEKTPEKSWSQKCFYMNIVAIEATKNYNTEILTILEKPVVLPPNAKRNI